MLQIAVEAEGEAAKPYKAMSVSLASPLRVWSPRIIWCNTTNISHRKWICLLVEPIFLKHTILISSPKGAALGEWPPLCLIIFS